LAPHARFNDSRDQKQIILAYLGAAVEEIKEAKA
jgi:hypothetical protein